MNGKLEGSLHLQNRIALMTVALSDRSLYQSLSLLHQNNLQANPKHNEKPRIPPPPVHESQEPKHHPQNTYEPSHRHPLAPISTPSLTLGTCRRCRRHGSTLTRGPSPA